MPIVTSAKTVHTRSIALASLMVAVLLAGACDPRHLRTQYPKRQVTAKEGISVLIANNERCLVPTDEFPKVKVGELWACNWRASGGAVSTAQRPAASQR